MLLGQDLFWGSGSEQKPHRRPCPVLDHHPSPYPTRCFFTFRDRRKEAFSLSSTTWFVNFLSLSLLAPPILRCRLSSRFYERMEQFPDTKLVY